jgi:hypothetical protein
MGMGQIVDYSQFILQIEKAIANGVASLDSNAKVPKNQISLNASDVGAIAVEADPTVSNFTKSLTSNNTILTALNAASGTISASVLPSYVDDVLNFANLAAFPVAGETGKIYVTEDTNKTYRWSGTVYVEISSSATAGEALKLTNARTISTTGDATYSVSFDGSANVSSAITLATVNSNVGAFGGASSIPVITVNAKGQVTAVSTNSIGNELIAIQSLSDTPGFLKKTGNGTYSIDVSNYLTTNQSITVSGDVTGSGTTSISLTLANSGVTAGTYNASATQVLPFTVDAKGRITATGAAVSITPPWSAITGKPTTLAGFGITDGQPLGNELTALQSLSDTPGFLKKTGDGNYSIDNNNYLPLSGGTVTNELSVQHISQSGDTWTSTFSASGIELGRSTSASAFSLIDFHSGGTSADFAARIRCFGDDGNGENRSGSLEFLASNLSFITGDAYNSKTMTIDGNGSVTIDGTYLGNGSGLTSLNASNISTGTLSAARLPTSYLPLSGGNVTGNLGLGVVSPTVKLSIGRLGGAFTVPTLNANTALLLTAGGGTVASGSIISVLGGTTSQVGVTFGDTDASEQGGVYYVNSTDTLSLRAGNSVRISVDSTSTTFSGATESTSTTTGAIRAASLGITGAIFAGTVSANSYNLIPIWRGGGNISTNTVVGMNAGLSNTTGNNNSFVGVNAGYSNTTGNYNSFVGVNAGRFNTTGIQNSFVGVNAGYSNTTGNYNSFVGVNAGYSNTTGIQNSFVGVNAGRYTSDGVTDLTISNNSCFFGMNTKGTQNATNENVFGFNATGNGSNTVTIGDSNIINNFFRGALSLNATQVISTRRTGWVAPTGTATRTTFATSTVTLPQLAERVKALIDDLTTHGLIGA